MIHLDCGFILVLHFREEEALMLVEFTKYWTFNLKFMFSRDGLKYTSQEQYIFLILHCHNCV